MAASHISPSKREKAFPELKLRFWGGRNSVMGGGLLADSLMSTRGYRNVRAERKKVRDSRKAAITCVDEDDGAERAKSPTSIDEKGGGVQKPERGCDQECDTEAKEAEVAEHDGIGADDQVPEPAGPGPSEDESAKEVGTTCSSSSHHRIKQGSAHNSEQGPAIGAQFSTSLRGGAGSPQRHTSTPATKSGSARPPKATPACDNTGAQPQQQTPSFQHPPRPVSRPNQANNSRPALTRPSAPPTIPQLNALRAHTIRPESSISQQLSADPAVPGHDQATPLGQYWEYSREEWDLSGENAPCAVISEVTSRRKISNWIDGQSQDQQRSPKPTPQLGVAEQTCPRCRSRWPYQSEPQNRPVSRLPALSQKPSAPQDPARFTAQGYDSPHYRRPSQSKCQCTARQDQSQQGAKTQPQQQTSGLQPQTQIHQGSGAQRRQTSPSKTQTRKQAPTDRCETTIRATTSQRNQPPATSQCQQNSKPKKPSHRGNSQGHGPHVTINLPTSVSGSTTAVAIASVLPSSAPHTQPSTTARSQKQTIPFGHLQKEPVPPPPPPPPPPAAQAQPQQAPPAHPQPHSLSPSQRLRRAADHAPEGCYLTVLPTRSTHASGPASTPRVPPFTLDAHLADIAAQQQKNLLGDPGVGFGFGFGFGNLRGGGGGHATPSPCLGGCFDPACHCHREATATAATTASWHWRRDAETEAHWHGGERCWRDGGSCCSASSREGS
ncbi:hypothetical protein PV04_02405 [Phialophora macrospora]|uniref:Uncharacterized protein n=1 Tax=Phialophora macrospora TaxID=1851006 RepID=A0A0D2GDB9_9EURO|nr:hypothetical protein PV04_02405 [Phialophora macrospora]